MSTRAHAAPDCSRIAGPTEVNIDRVATPVTYNLGETAAQIGARSGLTSHDGAVVRGLTESAFHSKLSVTLSAMTTSEGVCVHPSAIDLHIGFDPVIVYIERDYGRGSCQFEAIDAHEQGHVRNMNVALEAALPKIRRALAEAARDPRYPLFARDEDGAQRDAIAIIDAALNVPLADLARERATMDGALDSPESYRILKSSCETW
ncbi:MAG TPA: hypothetical protein VL966_06190 [Alphaproteobacteria bacterium]|nr:hypothetical protein [Alphaproteobacteria bacterium]